MSIFAFSDIDAQPLQVAVSDFPGFLIAEMEAPALTVAPIFATGAVAFPRPSAIPHDLEAVFPDIEEIVLVNVSLDVISAERRTGGNGAVRKNGADVYTRAAEKRIAAGHLLIRAEKTFAAIVGVDSALLTGLPDEIENLLELGVVQFENGISLRPPFRKNGGDAPVPEPETNEELTDLGKLGQVLLVDAGNDIEGKARNMRSPLNSLGCSFKRMRMPPKMIMGKPEPIQADRHGAEARCKQALEAWKRHGEPVRDHPPRESPFKEGLARLLKIFAHEGLSPRKHNQSPGGNHMPAKSIEDAEEIGYRHIGKGFAPAVAPAVEAVKIAAEGAFPKKIRERMVLNLRMAIKPIELKRSSFPKGKIRSCHPLGLHIKERRTRSCWKTPDSLLKKKIRHCSRNHFLLRRNLRKRQKMRKHLSGTGSNRRPARKQASFSR